MAKRLKGLRIDRIDLVDHGANPGAYVALFKRADPVDKAVWTTAFVNDLPDSSFAVILSGGKKEDGKTTPRSLRKFPYKDKGGKVDLPHLRNALARLSQAKISPAARERARRKLEAAAKAAGVGEHKQEKAMSEIDLTGVSEEVLKHLETLETAKADLEKAKGELEDKVKSLEKPEPKPDPLERADPEVQKRVDDLEKRATDAEAKVEKMEQAAERAEMIAKAGEFKFAKADDLGPVLLHIRKALDEKEYDWLLTRLRSLDAIARQTDLMKELGAGGDGDTPTDPYAKIEKLAEAYVKDHPETSKAEAVAKVIETDAGRALYAQYDKQLRGEA